VIISAIFVAIALASLGLLFQLKRGHTSAEVLEKPAEHLRSVDLEAFRNLIDPAEEEFLRKHLLKSDFRKIQRERSRAAIEYISCAAQNAVVLLRIGEAARQSPDPVTAEAAARLVNDAIQLRLYAFQAIPQLYFGIIFPGWRPTSLHVIESYEKVTRGVVRLGLRYPADGVAAAL
jgi:hypothetical protein